MLAERCGVSEVRVDGGDSDVAGSGIDERGADRLAEQLRSVGSCGEIEVAKPARLNRIGIWGGEIWHSITVASLPASPTTGGGDNGRVTVLDARPAQRAGPAHSPLPIGPYSVWPPVVLAPMAGITNASFRALCREFGAGLYVCEMITTRALVERDPKTMEMIRFGPERAAPIGSAVRGRSGRGRAARFG